jgi:hypothetical protein
MQWQGVADQQMWANVFRFELAKRNVHFLCTGVNSFLLRGDVLPARG